MSVSTASRSRSTARADSNTFQMLQHPAFAQAVNRLANIKCLQAIKDGKLRVVSSPSLPKLSAPLRYTPRMDLIDDPQSSKLVAVFEIPGMKTSDISVQIREGQLVVFGERRSPYLHATQAGPSSINPESAGKAIAAGEMEVDSTPHHVRLPVQELRFGTFQRNIRIPNGIKETDISASLSDGMLTVTWPRSPASAAPASVTARLTPSSSPPTSTVVAGTALQ